ncbi:MAG: pyridoxal-phosphate-dependent aminotransferase family protein [Candidatus Promineifilaceae bacterium]|jgi:alanine-glyoxylate transaminase/serine-glyoxylate transaminase/serine-pyruvate transaminase
MTIHTGAVNEDLRVNIGQLDMPPRLLLGPGPSNAHPRVLQAIAMRQVGHLDPAFIAVMDDVQDLLRYVWQTVAGFTLAISGTGSAAMEASIANIIEPGDVMLVGVIGYFGERMAEMARRYGAEVHVIEKPWGEAFTAAELYSAVEQIRPAVLGLVQGETSTGVLQPLDGVGDLCREFDCLLLVDAVTSLATAPLLFDDWDIDVAYSCSQKGLSCPPGLGPVAFGPRAMNKIQARKTTVRSWYFDTTLLATYWEGNARRYHHTAPINMNYALREGLRLVAEEGLEDRWARHQEIAEFFWDGLSDLGLSCHAPRELRLPALTTVRVPDGVDAGAVARELLLDYNIEVAGGFGQLAGKVWRVGLMGFNSRRENAMLLLDALGRVLDR